MVTRKRVFFLISFLILPQCSPPVLLNQKYSDAGFLVSNLLNKNISIIQPTEVIMSDVNLAALQNTFKDGNTVEKTVAESLAGQMRQSNKFGMVEVLPQEKIELFVINRAFDPRELRKNRDVFTNDSMDFIIHIKKIMLYRSAESHQGLGIVSLSTMELGVLQKENVRYVTQAFFEIWDVNKNRLLLDIDIADRASVFFFMEGEALEKSIERVTGDFIRYLVHD